MFSHFLLIFIYSDANLVFFVITRILFVRKCIKKMVATLITENSHPGNYTLRENVHS